MDLISDYHSLCRKRQPDIKLEPHAFNVEELNEFLKEAYKINKSISDLTAYLRRVRGPYLTLTRPPRHLQRPRHSQQDEILTDSQRSQIDASTSQLISNLNAYIGQLSDAENARLSLRQTIIDKKRNKRGLGRIGRWAGGGGVVSKTQEEEEEDAQEESVAFCRQEVLQYLRRHLERAGDIQRYMVEVRLDREREKEASILYLAKGSGSRSADSRQYSGFDELQIDQLQQESGEGQDMPQLTPEQLQLFEKENSTMLKHYTDQLDQVKNVQATLYSISELQTQLAANLNEQHESIQQLAQDAELTQENVGRGNLQLKKASERKSTAQMVFWTTCAFCTSLIVWDLIF